MKGPTCLLQKILWLTCSLRKETLPLTVDVMVAICTVAHIEKSYKFCRLLVAEYNWTAIGRGDANTPDSATGAPLMYTYGASRAATNHVRIVFVGSG